MEIYDQHLHTSTSLDSEELMENYIKALINTNTKRFVSTEHLEVKKPQQGGVPDFSVHSNIINSLRRKYEKIDILMGIEIGYAPIDHEEIMKILNKFKFDLVLLSIHEGIYNNTNDSNEGYDKYLDLCCEGVTSFDDFDVFAHLDFFIRYVEKDSVDITLHKSKLEKFLLLIIEKNKTLEFNTVQLYRFNEEKNLRFIFSLYKELGGEFVSIGSDAHGVLNFQKGIDRGLEILKELGFTSIQVYKNRIRESIKI